MADHNFDLEERTFQFAKAVRGLIRELPTTLSNREDSTQLLRCSASVGANYIEANEALSKKDFLYRIKIARKEAKESVFLDLLPLLLTLYSVHTISIVYKAVAGNTCQYLLRPSYRKASPVKPANMNGSLLRKKKITKKNSRHGQRRLRVQMFIYGHS